MRKLLLLHVVFFVSVNVFAQNKKMATSIEEVDNKIIKMPRFPIADLPKKCIPISDITIMQFLRDSIHLGLVFKGPDNQVAELITKKPLTIFLQEHIYKMYEDDFKKTGVNMFWVLKELRIGEKSGNLKEYSYLKFKADAYISNDKINYYLVASLDTVFATSSGVDVTAWHGTEIEDALKLLLKLSIKNEADKSYTRGNNITQTQIIEKENRVEEPSILNAGVYIEGAYLSFDEFLNNNPSISDYEMRIVNKKSLVCLSENKLDTLKIWGLCKNKEIYKYEDGLLIPLEKYEKGFIISDFIKKINRKNANAFAAAVIGGLAGSLLQSSLSTKRLFVVKIIPHISKIKMQPHATCIDMQTGELSF